MSFKQLLVGFILLVSSPSLMARDIDTIIKALAPYAGGAKRPFYELRATSLDDGILKADVAWIRSDGRIYEAILTISEDELKAVETRIASPAVDSELAASLQSALQTLTAGPLVITGFARATANRGLVAYETISPIDEAPLRFLAEVIGPPERLDVRPYHPQAKDQQLLQDLALVMARFQAFALATRYDTITAAARERGEEFPGPLGPVARLEVELRLARVGTRHLQKQTAEESAVGFDPKVEWVQYMMPAVLSDNAIFVTFGKEGQYRLEDFN